MNSLLIVREEIICLVILFFIMLYSNQYSMGKDKGSFFRICIFAIGHVAFDLITVLTVNAGDEVPDIVNHGCHIIFYLFALLYSYELFCYISALCYSKTFVKKVRIFAVIPLAIYAVISPFLPIEYLSGDGTQYSFGVAAFVGYGVALLFLVMSIFVVLKHFGRLDIHIKSSLLPMLCAAIIAEALQVVIPELLFTGGAITIITVGFFFSLENPVAVLRQKVLVDALTGVKSRHSYETDIVKMNKQFASGTCYGMVFFDINDLKAVNDKHGHMEGDVYIGNIAQILSSCLKSAENIYRMGGDEFLAVYRDKSETVVRIETDAVAAACAEQSLSHPYAMGLAVGHAMSDENFSNLGEVLRAADYRMYSSKTNIKQKRAYMLADDAHIDITGLTDRIFDAFAVTDPTRFLFVCNMSTNVSRLSDSAVEYFSLKSEFIYDFQLVWAERMHPDDRQAFLDDIAAVFSGERRYHDLQYRILNGNGDYVVCHCTGTVLRGKNSEAVMFAGTMIIQNASDSIDTVTDLRTGYEMMNYFTYLINNHIPAAAIKFSITNLSSINMLYGYGNGNSILRQFGALLREIVGTEGSIFHSDGTKFVVCVPNLSASGVSDIYRRVCTAAEHKIHIDSLSPPLKLAAGAFMLTADFPGSSTVMRSHLIYAHNTSKYDKRGKLQFYNGGKAADENKQTHNSLLQCIHQDAIAAREGFYMLYQPIVRVDSGKIVGAEALIRWGNEEYGEVSPNEFIPWLEGDPCFIGLGNWILKSALAGAKEILKTQPDFSVSVNIAMPQLEHEDFRETVLSALEKTGFPPNRLCLELTERCRELDNDYLRGEVDFFRSRGIRIALDDLGTGFSSFGLLLGVDVDELKLDRAFVKEIQTKKANRIFTGMLIEASKSMGYSICLEGVEDDGLRKYLDSYGATYYQGFYCMKPSRIEEFIPYMQKWNGKE